MVKIKGAERTPEVTAAFVVLYPVPKEVVEVLPEPVALILEQAGVEYRG